MNKKIWIAALIALMITGIALHVNILSDRISLSQHSSAVLLQEGWTFSNSDGILAEELAFRKVAAIKDQTNFIITHQLPRSEGQSLCFVTIGYQVEATVDGIPFYQFGANRRGQERWGVATHLFELPDGDGERTLTLEFHTSNPPNVAVSSFILMDGEVGILKTLLRSNAIKIILPFLYVSIGLFLLVLAALYRLFHRWDFSIVLLALLSMAMGLRILLNISIIAYFAGPIATYWSIQLLNLVIPILILLFLSTDHAIKDRWLLFATSALQGISLIIWIILNALDLSLSILSWNSYLFLLMILVLSIIFIREARAGRWHLKKGLSLFLFFTAVLVNAYLYYQHGVQNTMDISLTMLTFPFLILLSGQTIYASVRREEALALENSTLKREGDLLLKNYNRIEHYIDETRRIWHDIDKHFAVMNHLSNYGEYKELKDYLHRISHTTKSVKNPFMTSNTLVNAIFTDKISEAESYGITCRVALQVPDKLTIAGNDLCSLLINLMDNAIEACLLIPEESQRYIDIKLQLKQDFLYYGIENSCPNDHTENEEQNNPMPSSGRRHLGYGLKIASGIAEKYDGIFEYNQIGSIYTVHAALNNTKASRSPSC
jgi:hypothetical protein